MGWGTDFTADIYISRERFKNEYELDEKIKKRKTTFVLYVRKF